MSQRTWLYRDGRTGGNPGIRLQFIAKPIRSDVRRDRHWPPLPGGCDECRTDFTGTVAHLMYTVTTRRFRSSLNAEALSPPIIVIRTLHLDTLHTRAHEAA